MLPNRVRSPFQSLLSKLYNGIARHPRRRMRRDDWTSPASRCAEVLEARALLSAGVIDPTFGNGGTTAPLPNSPVAGATAIQSNGDTVVASTYWTSITHASNHLVLARYTSGGTLDTTFGKNGVVDMTFGPYAVVNVSSITIQADGKILVAGGLDGNVNKNGATNFGIEVFRFNASGSLDTKYGTQGRFDYQPTGAGPNNANDIAIDPQGRLVLDVSLINGATGSGIQGVNLVRVNSNGKLDTTFANNGLDETGILHGSGTMLLQSVPTAVDPNGYQILVAGGGPLAPSGVLPRYEAGIARFSSNGTLDASFGSGGTTVFLPLMDPSQALAGDTAQACYISDIAFESDGSIVAVGNDYLNTSSTHLNSPFVAHLSANGVLDSAFGNNNGFAVNVFSPEGFQVGAMNSVKIDSSGNILAVATATSSTGATYATLIRYTSAGLLDTTFGADGTGFVFAGPGDSGLSVNIDPTTGKLIVTINGGSGFELIRYTNA